VLAVVVILVAVIVYRGFLRPRDRRDQDRRIDTQAQGRANSPAGEIDQREDRRPAGMTVDDRAWEQSSLQRHRESQSRTRGAEVPAAREAHRERS
jgi:flagellar biosynthesis/type III secretory pathway M-ring protein FliF/YscJ